MQSLLGRWPGDSYMNATFAAPGWRESVSHLDWGDLFSPLKGELLWVLETTVADAAERASLAEDLAAGTRWFSDAFLAMAITDSHLTKTPPPKRIAWSHICDQSNLHMLTFVSRCFSVSEQKEFFGEVESNEWSCKLMDQPRAMELLEMAVIRWYATHQASDEIMRVENPVGAFYLYPTERANAVESTLALH